MLLLHGLTTEMTCKKKEKVRFIYFQFTELKVFEKKVIR